MNVSRWNDAFDQRPRAGDEQVVYVHRDGLHCLLKVVHTGKHWEQRGLVAQSPSIASLSAAARLLSGVVQLELETALLDADIAAERRHRLLELAV